MFYRSSDSSWQIFIEVNFISEKPSKKPAFKTTILISSNIGGFNITVKNVRLLKYVF